MMLRDHTQTKPTGSTAPGQAGSVPKLGVVTAAAVTATVLAAVAALAIWIEIAQAASGDTVLVSRADGTEPDFQLDDMQSPAISANGNIVIFNSAESDLDPSASGFGEGVFARDISAGTTRLVSRADGPTGAPGNFGVTFWDPAVSANGRFAAFITSATNLGEGDNDNIGDVYVRDLQEQTTTLVSRANGVAGAKANDDAGSVAISADGRFVAFSSEATNLHPHDTDSTHDIFVRDIEASTTTLVSRASGAAGAKANAKSFTPSISSDGRYVAFASEAGNLDANDLDSGQFGGTDIFVRDTQGLTTTLVSQATTGVTPPDGNEDSFSPSISADGSRVAFESASTNLGMPLDTDTDFDIYVRDIPSGQTILASSTDPGTGPVKANAPARSPSISGDGKFVAFSSRASNLASDANTISDVFVRNIDTGAMTLASRPGGFSGFSDADSGSPSTSGDGRFVAFDTRDDLHPDDGEFNGLDVYVRELGAAGPSGDLSIAITRPEDGARLLSRPIRVSGTVNAPAGVSRFCVVANRPQTAIPTDCDQRDQLLAGGSFAGVEAVGARNGSNVVTAWIEDASGDVESDSITVQVGRVDLSVTGFDLTQGIQAYRPAPNAPYNASEPAIPFRHRLEHYLGVPLVTGKKTIARMYTEVDGGCVPGVSAALHAFSLVREGRNRSAWRPLPQSPLMPMESARKVCTVPLSTQRATPSGPGTFNYALPDGWLRKANEREIRLVGEVNPTFIEPRFRDPVSGNNAFGNSIDATYIHKPRKLTINPVRMVYGSVTPKGASAPIVGTGPSDDTTTTPPDPASFYRKFVDLVPFDVQIKPWLGEVNIENSIKQYRAGSADMCDEVVDDLDQFEDEVELSDRDWPFDVDSTTSHPMVGIFDSDQKVCAGISQPSVTLFFIDVAEAVAVAAANRPLTSVAHETTHQLGFAHAGDNDRCYAGTDIFNSGTDWAFDDRGTINGWGLDINEGSGFVPGSPGDSGPFAVFGKAGLNFDGSLAPRPGNFFDYMSYCSSVSGDVAGTPAALDAWISIRNWITMVRNDDPGPVIRPTGPAAAKPGPTLRVGAVLSPSDEVSNFTVVPGTLGPSPSVPGSDYRVVVRSAAGGVVSDTPVDVRVNAVSRSTEPPSLYLDAEVPAGGANAVQLLKDGSVLAERTRSPSAPTVKVLTPTGKTKVGSRGTFPVRWRAADADGDALTAAVDFSANGGKHWQPLTGGVIGNSVRISADLLEATKRAKLRIRVNDGFNQSADTSPQFKAAGSKPLVRLTDPSPGARIAAHSRLQVAGEALDDRGFPIRGKALRWLSGKKVVARGEVASIPAFKLRRKLTLLARDRKGRASRKSIKLRVTRVAPLFTELRAPKRIGKKARRFVIKAASTIPARLKIKGKGAAAKPRSVGLKPTKIPVRIRPGKKAVKLKIRLTASKKTTKHVIRVKRK